MHLNMCMWSLQVNVTVFIDGSPPNSLLRQGLTLIMELINLARLMCQWALRDPLPLPPQCWGYRCVLIRGSTQPLLGFWGLEFKSSCMYSREFTHWVISSAPHLIIFNAIVNGGNAAGLYILFRCYNLIELICQF